ncbi:MAG: preprotein translocase subunit SecE [Actinobacteria bacterium ADurb.BinA094]|nr:MAG: preprotein translocase subunit SecE [Actinobacteria bacterium ADurb.BinA094]
MAKTADNKKAAAKTSATGKPGRGKRSAQNSSTTRSKKAPAKRTDAKAARVKASQKAQPRAKGRPAEKKGLMKFLRDVRVEMGKVTWPTRKDLAQSTLVVLVAVAIAAVYTLVVDQAFLRVVNFFVNLIT